MLETIERSSKIKNGTNNHKHERRSKLMLNDAKNAERPKRFHTKDEEKGKEEERQI